MDQFAGIGLIALAAVTMLSLLTGTALAHDNGGPADRQRSDDARGAEIHLVVRSHGPVIPGLNHAMFNSFEVGCDVNVCADVQFAVFE